MAYSTKEILNKKLWDDFITQDNLRTSFFQSWEWGEFEKSNKRIVFHLGIFDEKDKLQGGALITKVDALRGSFLHVRNGPVLDYNNINLLKFALKAIINKAQQLKVSFVRISPLIPFDSSVLSTLKKMGFKDSQMHDVDAEITWILNITETSEQLLKNMRKSTRYEINKAKKLGLQVESHTDSSAINIFWPIFVDTVKRQKWSAYSKKYILKEFKEFAAMGMAKIYLAKLENKYIAGSIFIYFGDTVYYHHSGSLTKYRNLPGPYAIHWKAINDAKLKGYKKYNFFGIARDDSSKHPWHGLTFFKKGFGGYEQRSIHAQDYPIKKFYWFTHYYEKLERFLRGY